MYQLGRFTRSKWEVSKVAKVTKTGCTLEDGTRWTRHGPLWGGRKLRRSYLSAFDPSRVDEQREEVERVNLAAELESHGWRCMTIAQLRAVRRALDAALRESE